MPNPVTPQASPRETWPEGIQHYPDFPSQHIPPRRVDVWVPPGYAADAETRLPVIYMQDGQNLFTPSLAYGGEDWGIAEAITRLALNRVIRGAIVVGVWNYAARWREYMPQKPLHVAQAYELLARFSETQGGPPYSDGVLRFLVEELKPFIDRTYRTLPGQPDTFIMGSSMGGLFSLYALEQYPQVFGGAGCLSTHWPSGGNLLVDQLGAALPPPGRHKLYFDYGTLGLDAEYEPYQQRFDEHLRATGYLHGTDWLTRKFVGADHNEASWRARLDIPLQFLLGVD
jgi:predicted alpha/beta superfamily hydrolase